MYTCLKPKYRRTCLYIIVLKTHHRQASCEAGPTASVKHQKLFAVYNSDVQLIQACVYVQPIYNTSFKHVLTLIKVPSCVLVIARTTIYILYTQHVIRQSLLHLFFVRNAVVELQ